MTEWPLNKCVPLLMVKRCVVALSALWVTCGPHTHTLTLDTKLIEVPGGLGTLARQPLSVNIYSQFES